MDSEKTNPVGQLYFINCVIYTEQNQAGNTVQQFTIKSRVKQNNSLTKQYHNNAC